ncbi:MAG TPA: PD-(D/E)XK nuclease family protein, partial [Gemmataceae bacterium]|nr:PD-(D/E)XK nuclease family protein [Gemmataceae bacterium]
ADSVRRRLATSAVLCPNVFALQSFAEAACQSSPLSASGRRRLLDQIANDLARRGRIAFFRRIAETRGFLNAAEGLLGELENLGVTPEQFAAVAHRRATKLAACAELFTEFARRAGSSWGLLDRAATLVWAALPDSFASVRSVFVDGFTRFCPAELRLLKALAQHAELWVGLPDAVGDGRAASECARQTRARLIERLGLKVESGPTEVPDDRPSGLAGLDRLLFGPAARPAADATGVELIEAAGMVGEARLVARRVRKLISEGTCPDRIVVTARETPARDLLGEVLTEYGLPVESDGDESLLRVPAVATLLRAARLADEGWPFAGVTALLRSTYFRPAWPEGDAETAVRAEGLLRLLGEPGDREAYLRAVRVWSEAPPDGLEDEQAEESRRRLKARLAAECRPFLERFFRAWDALPAAGPPRAFAAWLTDFARELGLAGVAEQSPRDRAGLLALTSAVTDWEEEEITRATFFRGLMTAAVAESLPPADATAGRVLVVPPEEARHLDCDYLFILGLGEKSFPRLGPPPSPLDDSDRLLLRQAGLPFPDPAARLGDEQLLFLQLVARPRRGLILSYPAVDEKGQPLLPGSFLRAVRECFTPDAIRVERQRMLIEGYTAREPLSAAEARVQFAATMRGRGEVALWKCPGLADELTEHLRWAEAVATARFRSAEYNRYDGGLASPVAQAAVRERFGPDRVFSPTALEAYVACPFKFLLGHVLKLEELVEPGAEVEQTRRGAAYHRALSRLHRALAETDPEMTRATLPEAIGPALLAEIDRAVSEYAARAPSPASRRLWELEGKRLHRSAAKYRGHWDAFVDPWRKAQAVLTPQLLEADFGLAVPEVQAGAVSRPVNPLVISVGGVEVRVGGRIDRVDVAQIGDEIGYWVIDYKTGRSVYYTPGELARFEKLQLPLYALAVERVFFPGRKARPLGLAYWLVTDTGPKPVLPSRQSVAWLGDAKKWVQFRQQLEGWVAKVVGRIRDAQFPLAPRSDTCTETCAFGQVCRIAQSRNVGKVWDLSPPESAAPDAPNDPGTGA